MSQVGLAAGLLVGSQLPSSVLAAAVGAVLVVGCVVLIKRHRKGGTHVVIAGAFLLATILPVGTPASSATVDIAENEVSVTQACGFWCAVGAGLVAIMIWEAVDDATDAWAEEHCPNGYTQIGLMYICHR